MWHEPWRSLMPAPPVGNRQAAAVPPGRRPRLRGGPSPRRPPPLRGVRHGANEASADRCLALDRPPGCGVVRIRLRPWPSPTGTTSRAGGRHLVVAGQGVSSPGATPGVLAWVVATATGGPAVARCTGRLPAGSAGPRRRACHHPLGACRPPGPRVPRPRRRPLTPSSPNGRRLDLGGVTAGIDPALALVEAGPRRRACCPAIARHLVMFLRRPGGQSQFSRPAAAPRARPDPCAAQDHIHPPPTTTSAVERLARPGRPEPPSHFQRSSAARSASRPARYRRCPGRVRTAAPGRTRMTMRSSPGAAARLDRPPAAGLHPPRRRPRRPPATPRRHRPGADCPPRPPTEPS